jgi:hypothetical protein
VPSKVWVNGVENVKKLDRLLPRGCKPFYSPRQASLARVSTRRVYAIILLLVNPYEAIFPYQIKWWKHK